MAVLDRKSSSHAKFLLIPAKLKTYFEAQKQHLYRENGSTALQMKTAARFKAFLQARFANAKSISLKRDISKKPGNAYFVPY